MFLFEIECLQASRNKRWSRGPNVRGQGQELKKKNPKPRTDVSITHPLEAKDRNDRGLGARTKGSILKNFSRQISGCYF